MDAGRAVAIAALIAIGLAAGPAAGEVSPAVLEACRDELPDDLAELGEPDARHGRGAAGEWRIESAPMDAGETEEVILVALPAGKPGDVWFLAEREDDDPYRKKVSLKGRPVTHVSVAFPRFRAEAALAHVNAGEGGQVLLHWDGEKLREVWKPGKPKKKESRWFELDDLDADGTSEVIIYFRRELDIYADDEVITESGGADDRTMSSGSVDAVAVYRFDDGKWKKDGDLLESLR
jgi:hypothetical protein